MSALAIDNSQYGLRAQVDAQFWLPSHVREAAGVLIDLKTFCRQVDVLMRVYHDIRDRYGDAASQIPGYDHFRDQVRDLAQQVGQVCIYAAQALEEARAAGYITEDQYREALPIGDRQGVGAWADQLADAAVIITSAAVAIAVGWFFATALAVGTVWAAILAAIPLVQQAAQGVIRAMGQAGAGIGQAGGGVLSAGAGIGLALGGLALLLFLSRRKGAA